MFRFPLTPLFASLMAPLDEEGADGSLPPAGDDAPPDSAPAEEEPPEPEVPAYLDGLPTVAPPSPAGDDALLRRLEALEKGPAAAPAELSEEELMQGWKAPARREGEDEETYNSRAMVSANSHVARKIATASVTPYAEEIKNLREELKRRDQATARSNADREMTNLCRSAVKGLEGAKLDIAANEVRRRVEAEYSRILPQLQQIQRANPAEAARRVREMTMHFGRQVKKDLGLAAPSPKAPEGEPTPGAGGRGGRRGSEGAPASKKSKERVKIGRTAADRDALAKELMRRAAARAGR